MARVERKPIRVFGLGTGGVNLVKNPIVLDDNEVTLAQNAVPFQDGGVSGIRKRDGWQRVVPGGSVTPGSDAGGGILGGFTIDDPLGLPDPDGGTMVAPGATVPAAGGTVTTFTPEQGSYPDPNIYYNVYAHHSLTKSPIYPPVYDPLTGAFYYGGHESGQILGAQMQLATAGADPAVQLVIREVARVVGTGSTDDTFVCAGMYAGSLVIALEGGGVWLYFTGTGETRKLPDTPNSTRVVGAAEVYGRLWVAAGLHLYSIAPDDETSWTDAVTVSDSSIAGLTGLAAYRPSNLLLAGSYTSGAADPVRVYAFTPAFDGTATAAAFPTNDATGPFTGAASVAQSSSGGYIWGPFPMGIADTRIYCIYQGAAPAFTNLKGAVSETMAGTAKKILSYDGLHWHNGADTNTDDLVNDAMEGSTSLALGPLVMSPGGRYQYLLNTYLKTSRKFASVIRSIFDNSPDTFDLAAAGSTISDPATFWSQPTLLFA